MPARPITLIEAPTNLGLQPPAAGAVPGVAAMPARLRVLGLADRLGVGTTVQVPAPAYRPEIEAGIGVRNAAAIVKFSHDLAAAVGHALGAGRFPLVVGGDCTVLLGSALALARRGRHGLLFLDGHQDLLTPVSSRSGGAAGMDLALVLGRGPASLTSLDGAAEGPLLRAEDVVMLGYRDDDAVYSDPAVQPLRAAACRLNLAEVRAAGPGTAAARALAHLDDRGLAGCWLHLDVDVLDDRIMPAVDDRQPGGLSYDELATLLDPLLGSGQVVGMEVTVYDPTLDPGGRIGAELVAALVAALRFRPAPAGG